MRKVLVLVLALCGVFALSSVSHAENYMAGYIGAAIPHDSDTRDNTGTGASGTLTFNSGLAIGAKAGHWFNEVNAPFLGLELDVNAHFPSTDTLTLNGVPADISADVSVFSMTGNVLLRYPVGQIRPYVGVGGGWFHGDIHDGTLTVGGVTSGFIGESDDELGGQVLAGVDFFINPNLSFFGEYKYSWANFRFGGEVGLDVDYRVSQIYFGAAYHF